MTKVLVIDDNLTIQTILRLNLEKAGFHVITISDGKQVFMAVEKEMPDIVITDLYMPEWDGYTVISKLRKILTDLPIFVISGGSNIEKTSNDLNTTLEIAQDMGANEVIEKPIDMEKLIALIHQYVK